MRATLIIFITIFTLFSCKNTSDTVLETEPPIIDGFNNEYKNLPTQSFELAENVNLKIYQNQHFVWFTYNVPEGSYGTMDMTIEAPNLSYPKNLHISAQLGEWNADQPESAPQVPESEQWGKIEGWTGNIISLKGLDTTGVQPQLKFKSAPARELQLSKSYFGKGLWKLSIEIRAIKDNNGQFQTLKFPENEEKFQLNID